MILYSENDLLKLLGLNEVLIETSVKKYINTFCTN